jgi:predicted double-glycine peptidase
MQRPLFHPIGRGGLRVPVPDTTQQTDYSCGASSLQAVCKYYGVGPDDEWEFTDALKMDRRVGSHAFQIKAAARRWGLRCREYQPMSYAQLRAELQQRHPVLLMIQAWGEEKVGGRRRWRRDYRNEWKDGHWVVAIGYDREGFFFEDPSLQAVRGYLTQVELEERWHDVGPRRCRMRFYGMALWHPGRRRSAYETRAERIR